MSEATELLYYGEPITNDLEAEESLAIIKEAQDQVDRMAAWYKQALAKIKEQQSGIIENEKARLKEYFDTVPHRKAKASESYTLPSGKLVVKKVQPEFKKDEAILLEWAKHTAPELVKVEESVRWADLKGMGKVEGNLFTLDGEIVPGIAVIPKEDEFGVEGLK